MSVKSFLVTLKGQLDSNALKLPLKFVTGNQSADLDSVISAISYSYFNYRKNKTFLIPLINISRNDFRLRRDIEALLKSHSITEDYLYFVEDLKNLTTSSQTPIELILVDHCNIQGELLTKMLHEGLLDVISIIDHHQDEQVFLKADPRIINSNGSCSSLVFNYWYDQFTDKSVFYESNNEIVLLLLGPLLIDTTNMSQKVEEADVNALEKYQDILMKVNNLIENVGEFSGTSSGDVDSVLRKFYKQIKAAKKDLNGFKFYDILKKDYKQFEFESKKNGQIIRAGFSSIGKSYSWLFLKYNAEEISETFRDIREDFNLDLLVMTTSYTTTETEKYTREFGFTFNSSSPYKELLIQLSDLAKDDLELNSDIYHVKDVDSMFRDLNEDQVFKVFNQGNIKASRKQIVPVVKNIIENY